MSLGNRIPPQESMESSPRELNLKDKNFKRYVVTKMEDYFDTSPIDGHSKCIGCAKCLSPSKGTLLQYKYPKNLHSVNKHMLQKTKANQLKNKDELKQIASINYDYDRFR